MAIKRYVGDRFIVDSTDTKPLNIEDGAISDELDTLKRYVLKSGAWVEFPSSSGQSDNLSKVTGVSVTGSNSITGLINLSGIAGIRVIHSGINNILISGSEGGGATDNDAIHDNVAGEIAAITEKTIPFQADWALIEDTEASNAKKKITLDNIRRPAVHLYTGFQILDKDDYIVQANPNGGAFDLTLPLAANSTNVDYWIKNIHDEDTPLLRILTSGSNKLEFGGFNFLNISLGGMDSIKIFSDGTQWWTLSYLDASATQTEGAKDGFDIWLEDAPVISAGGSNEFNIWLEGGPVVDSEVTG